VARRRTLLPEGKPREKDTDQMNRLTVTFSALALATALAAGCNKKEEAKPADSTGAAPSGAAGEQPAPTSGAEPAAAEPTAAAEPAAGGAAAPNLSIDEVCTKSVGMMEGMGAAVTSNKGNCDAMGDALQKWADDNKELIAWGKANETDAAKKKEFDEKCMPKMQEVMQKLGPAMEGAQACATNEKVKAAMATLQ
jgi:hypothetical protein